MIATELIVLACALFTINHAQSTKTPPAPVALAHVSNSFHFLVHAPLGRAAPLFGPEGERVWAGEEWNPQFLYPQPAKDVPGAVFTVQQGDRKSVWISHAVRRRQRTGCSMCPLFLAYGHRRSMCDLARSMLRLPAWK